MTEEQQLLAMLERAGVKHTFEDHDGGRRVDVQNGGEGEEGYCGFFSGWEFDRDGKLVCVSHWE